MSRVVARETAFKIVFELAFQEDKMNNLYEKYKESVDETTDITAEDEKYIYEV